MAKRKYERTEGENKNYNKQEQDSIINEIYYFLKDHKKLSSILKSINTESRKLEELKKEEDNIIIEKEKKRGEYKHKHELMIHNFTNRKERDIDEIILSEPELYQGIQQIYRKHGVDIPSQKTVDKGEVMDAKKKIISEVLNFTTTTTTTIN